MVVDLKLCRFENAPWGFRLIGGSDFDYPLTVVKVTEGSLADQAGMKVGDVVVRINDISASTLNHNDAHKVIMHCGNNFFLGVVRENENENDEEETVSTAPKDEINEVHVENIEINNDPSMNESIAINDELATDENLQKSVDCKDTMVVEGNVTDDHIAEMMSGEAEVLKEHNVIGVNFNRIFPKAGVCQSSEVFRTLNEEAVKTRDEKEKDKRKWTTFLQKPNRPIPKSKQQIEEEARIAYKVQIVRQPKPKVDPKRTPSPQLPQITVETLSEPEIKIPPPEPNKEEEINEEPPTDSEVPNLELVEDVDLPEEDIVNEQEEENVPESTDGNTTDDTVVELERVEEVKDTTPPKTEEEIQLEQQLAHVQKQLMALSTLPSTIQATLDAVTKQLSELLPTFRLQPSPHPVQSEPTKEIDDTIGAEDGELEENGQNTISDIEVIENTEPNLMIITEEKQQIEVEDEIEDIIEAPVEPTQPTPEELEQQRIAVEQEKLQEELIYKKQKEQEMLNEEHEQRLIRQRTPKRPPRPFGPLTPQERPLILPGGRRWRKPKDAYNEEFIAEILSSQAELIIGSTLGSTYESPLLGYDERESNCVSLANQIDNGVNFLKYQKPQKHIDLDKSEVYKVIHNLEKSRRRGIEARPEKVLAEEDVRSHAAPISCG